MNYTVLEIGSGSFKLQKHNGFNLRFQSSLGKNLVGSKLHADSVKVALTSLDKEIIPLLEKEKIKTKDVLVFATAAIREAMKDPQGSGLAFLEELKIRGFVNPLVFNEDDECNYAAWAVCEELSQLDRFLLLDTGGASHQLIEIKKGEISKKESFPIGSHSNLDQLMLPDFKSLGYSSGLPLVLIGTSAVILNAIENFDIDKLRNLVKQLPILSLDKRRELLVAVTPNTEVHKLYIDFRLEILPNAFKLVLNCAENLGVTQFIACKNQAIDYIARNGFRHPQP